MISVQQIQNELLPLSAKCGELSVHLMSEESGMRQTLEPVRKYFGDQDPGRAIIDELSRSMTEVESARCELEQLKRAIMEFTRFLASN